MSETAVAAKPPPRGLFWIIVCNVVLSVNYSMCMITGSDYITKELHQSEIFYGLVVALFPIGRIVFLIPVGLWSDRSGFRTPMLFANCISVVGGCLYGLALYFVSPNLCLLGRFVGGIGATQPLSAWAARGYPPERRAEIESLQKSMNLLGVIIGPCLSGFFADCNLNAGAFILNKYTAAGYCPALLSLIVLIGTYIYLEEPPPIEQTESDVAENPFKVLITSGVWVCLLLALQTNLQLAAIDTILSALNQNILNWGDVDNSVCFGVIAMLSLCGGLGSIVLLKRGISCNGVIRLGLVINLVVAIPGMLAVLHPQPDVNMPFFLVFSALQCILLILYTGPTGGLYQQGCGKKQGLLGGVYTMFFAAGRPFGSLLGGLLLDAGPSPLGRDLGEGATLPMILSVILTIFLCIVFHFALWDRLQRTDQLAREETKASKEALVSPTDADQERAAEVP